MKILIKIMQRAKRYVKYLIIAGMSLLAITGINLISPWLIRTLISTLNNDFGEQAMPVIISTSVLLTLAYLVKVFFRFFSSYYNHKAAWSFVSDMRIELYNHLQKLSLSFYHDKQTGQLMSRVVNDSSTLEALIAHAIPDTITSILMLIGVSVLMFAINAKLMLLTCIPMPFIIIGGYLFAKKIRPNFRKAQKSIGELNAVLQDNLSGIREIQVFNQQQRELETVSAYSNKHKTSIISALKISGLFHPGIEFFTSLGTIVVIFFGGIMALKGALNTADIVAFLLYLNMFYAPVITLSRVVEEYNNAMAGAERIYEILNTEPAIKDNKNAKPLQKCHGNIEFKNVSFSYRKGIEVLKDISFKIEQGKMLAIVGPTGAGKTTIISLISRFYDVDGGEVLIEGKNIKDITLRSLRDNISIVLQDVFLFNGTISENIAYANPVAEEKDIVNAAKLARIHDDIMKMPEGYDTLIGERGLKLSGGQKQRLSIARAILRNTPILILDEATASVDTQTEKHIQEAINSLAGTRTMIVIAHRLSTIKKADKIIVIDNKGIVEEGTHEQLMKNNGLYSKLSLTQDFSEI